MYCRDGIMREKWNVLIVGAGTMGKGIAEVFSSKGFNTTLYDAYPEQLRKAKGDIQADMENLLDEGLVSEEELKNTQMLISYEDDLAICAARTNIVFECVFEEDQVKRDILKKLDELCTQECIFCSNTSGSNIFEIAEISNPERLIITHFFNPAYVMPLVEVVMGPKTSEMTLSYVKKILAEAGKDPAVIKEYIPGFIVNRIAAAITREAGYMITQGWTTGADIDRAIRNTSGLRYSFEGPLALYDVVGWDLTTTVSKVIHKSLCNDETENRLGKMMMESGELGLKSGKGIFNYKGIDRQQFMNERSQKIIQMIKAVR